jgi:hypothetical protein
MPILAVPWPLPIVSQTPRLSEKPTSMNYWKRRHKDKSKGEMIIVHRQTYLKFILSNTISAVLCHLQRSALVFLTPTSMHHALYFRTRAAVVVILQSSISRSHTILST